mgnify:CR=1 FL=1
MLSTTSTPTPIKAPVTMQEAMVIAMRYFDGDNIAADVYLKKYAMKTEDGLVLEPSPDQMHHRLAYEFARIETNYSNPLAYTEIRELLDGFKYVVPQGSLMSGIGNPRIYQSLSNCFTIEGPEDSYSGIMRADEELVQIMKRRGGVGLDISHLRPRGTPTTNSSGTSAGAAGFMERFSNSTREVGQGGRRGALMLTIDVRHPDIFEFATIKQDLSKVTGANISIRVTDAFMSAVENNLPFELRWPVDSEAPAISRTIRARDLWDVIMKSAHNTAEPGILFWDTIQRRTPSDAYPEFRSISTNPCTRGSSLVLTKDGLIPIRDLAGKMAEIWNGQMWAPSTFWCSGTKPVYRMELTNGLVYEGTIDHRIKTVDGDVQLEHAEGSKFNQFLGDGTWVGVEEITEFGAQVLGFLQEDGTLHKATKKMVAHVGANDSDLRSTFEEMRDGCWKDDKQIILDPYITELATEFSVDFRNLPERELPKRLFAQSPRIVRAFLRGLFSANGSVILSDTGRIALKSSCKPMVQQVQQLLGALGYRSYITKNKGHVVEFSNGSYLCKDSYNLNISGSYARKFGNEIGFIQDYKNEKVKQMKDGTCFTQKSTAVKSVTYLGVEKVFDFNEPLTHWGWISSLQSHNCAELILPAYDACRLMAINTLSFVRDPFGIPIFDTQGFCDVVMKAQRLMDDVVDLELECVKRILEKIESDPEPLHLKVRELDLWAKIHSVGAMTRRTGLGLTAIADTIAAMNLTYGSDQSIALVDKIYHALAVSAWKSSIDMAAQRGSFPAFNNEVEENHTFIYQMLQLVGPEYQRMHQKLGRRNIAITTTAPTGTVSLLTRTSSGIEPVFRLSYTRRRKLISGVDNDVKPDSVDSSGDKWQHYNVEHPGFVEWKQRTGKTDIGDSPYHRATAADVPWELKIRIQATAQHYICHGISNTTNLPHSISPEKIRDIYMTGWKMDCKGITIYRDGCRDGVLIAPTPKKESENAKIEARPRVLIGKTYRVDSPLGSCFVTINDREGDGPIEVFCRVGKAGSDTSAVTEAMGRLISFALRMPSTMTVNDRIIEMIGQLSGIGGSRHEGMGPNRVRSLPDAIAHAMIEHIGITQPTNDSTPSNGKSHHSIDLCPQCGDGALIHEEGCQKCYSCNYSVC